MTIACVFALPAAAQVGSPAPLVTPGVFDGGNNNNARYTAGFQFSVTTLDPRYLTALGAYDLGSNGLASNIQIGLYDLNGTLLTSATVTSANAVQGSFRYQSIAPYLLTPNQSYVVGAFQYSGGAGFEPYSAGAGGTNPPPGVTYQGARITNGSGSAMRFPEELYPSLNGFYGANGLIQDATALVPEPSTWALMILGFGMIGGAMRRGQSGSRGAGRALAVA